MRLRSILYFFPIFLIFLILFCIDFTDDLTPILSHNSKFPISRQKTDNKYDILVVLIVIDIDEAENKYEIALNSVRCYCKMQKYSFKLIEAKKFDKICLQKDFMFQRHCIFSEIMKNSKYEYMMFLDADMAVVNPNVRIEEYISNHEIIFYDRFVNWEIAAGSYIAHNSQFTIDFLRKFADFEMFLPNNSFHGTDNGAIHVYFQQLFYPNLSENSKICLKIWEKSKDFDDLYTFEACIRSVMGDTKEFGNGKIRILEKGTGWVRDVWLSDSEWSQQRDFLLHGLKNDYKVTFAQGIITNLMFTRFNWRSPFNSLLDLKKCETNSENWKLKYNSNLIVSSSKIEKYLSRKFVEVEKQKWKYLSFVAEYM